MRSFAKRIITKYLEGQAKRLLKKYKPKLIAVGGSVGKTSTKMAVAKVLSQKFKVLAHESSYNGELSLPLAIFDLRVPQRLFSPLAWSGLLIKIWFKHRFSYPYQILVLELGADKPGDIAYFMRYIKPQIGIITAITPEHMEFFGSMEAVVEEEFDLARGSRKVLLNADDSLLGVKQAELKRPHYTFGIKKGEYNFKPQPRQQISGLTGLLSLPNQPPLQLNLRVISRPALFSVAAAAAVGDLLELSRDEIKQGLKQIKPVPGRMNPLPGKNGSLIIDDSYNSSPDAAMAALETLYSYPGRKLAIMGSMNELGAYSQEGHANVGRWCAKLDKLVTVGAEAKRHLAPAAITAGLKASRVKSFISPYRAGAYLARHLRAGDVILVKGSQNRIYVEEAIKSLLANPTDQERLVRQTPFWVKRKARQFSA